MLERLSSRDKALLVLAGFLGVVSVALIATSVHAAPNMPVRVIDGRGYNKPSMSGYQPSHYRGKFYHRDQDAYRACVGERESNWHYAATPKHSTANGAYQWLTPWHHGLPYMMGHELRSRYGTRIGNQIRDKLLSRPIYRWSRFMQDMAFYTVLNWDHKYSGAKHWSGGRWTCTPGMNSWRGVR